MPELPRTLIKLAAVFVEHQAKKNLGDEALSLMGNVLAEYAGEKTLDKLVEFVQQGERAQQLVEAFQEADRCFAETCGDDMLRQAIAMFPLAEIPSLEKLAAALPETLDDARLLAALRQHFDNDWHNAMTSDQLDRAASVYRQCLDRPLAAKCDQLLPTLFRVVARMYEKTERIDAVASKLLVEQEDFKALFISSDKANQLSARDWVRPVPPRPVRKAIGRRQELDAVRKILLPGEKVAITVAIHGMPGVGKTLLAEQLAVELADDFPGGVLFERLGASFRETMSILVKWGSLAFGNRPLPPGMYVESNVVRDLLAGHGSMLVILDDVWQLAAIRPLFDALPPDASVLITTRSENLARELRGEIYHLDIISEEDALVLLRTRVRKATDSDMQLLTELAQALGYHALALDIAGGSLDRLKRAHWRSAIVEIVRQVREGSGLGGIAPVEGDFRGSVLEVVLAASYHKMGEIARRRFRRMGAFAPDASFNAGAVARVFECSPEEAEEQLRSFLEEGLLSHIDSPFKDGPPIWVERWQQHSVLRGYALALLRREGEEEDMRRRHAYTYVELMGHADAGQVYFRMLPDYAQLRHAFDWALSHDVELADLLANSTAGFQENYNLVNDIYDWACRLQKRALSPKYRNLWGRIWMALANALWLMANLPNENKKARLFESLAASKEALKYQQPQAASIMYSRVQSNRAIVLIALAKLPGENKRDRLLESLAVLDDALSHHQHNFAPLDYAGLQSNRASILSELAELPEEDRHKRLLDSLDASNKALVYCQPQIAPLDYALVQLNLAWRLYELGNMPDEKKGTRLIESLNACREAQKYYQPHTAPNNFRKAQTLSAKLCLDLAYVSGQDLLTRLLESLAGYERLLDHYQPNAEPNEYAHLCLEIAHVSIQIARFFDQERRTYLVKSLTVLDQASQSGLPDVVYAKIQTRRATVLSMLADLPEENRHLRLLGAIQLLYVAYSFFEKAGLEGHAKVAAELLIDIGGELGDLFSALWAELDLGALPEWLLSNWKLVPLPEILASDRTIFVKALSQADKRNTRETLLAAAQSGNRLLDNPEVGMLPLAIDQLQIEVARYWNNAGSLMLLADDEDSAARSLSAFNESVRLQPNDAVYYRNRARANAALGNTIAVDTDLKRAAELEPDYPGQADLRKELEQMMKKKTAD